MADIEERQVREDYGGGEIVEVTRRMPVWLKHHNGGLDPMCAMLRSVEPALAEWIGQHPDSYPPIVIIICDGYATDGNPLGDAERIKSLRTNDGNVLLFTVHLSHNNQSRPTLFPSREDGLLSLGEGTDDSKMMFRMASVLPEGSRRAANSLGFAADENSRGLVLNADAVAPGAVPRHRHSRSVQPALTGRAAAGWYDATDGCRLPNDKEARKCPILPKSAA